MSRPKSAAELTPKRRSRRAPFIVTTKLGSCMNRPRMLVPPVLRTCRKRTVAHGRGQRGACSSTGECGGGGSVAAKRLRRSSSRTCSGRSAARSRSSAGILLYRAEATDRRPITLIKIKESGEKDATSDVHPTRESMAATSSLMGESMGEQHASMREEEGKGCLEEGKRVWPRFFAPTT